MAKGIPLVKIADTVEGLSTSKGSELAGLRRSLSNRQPATLQATALRRESWSMVDKESVNRQPKPQTIVGLL